MTLVLKMCKWKNASKMSGLVTHICPFYLFLVFLFVRVDFFDVPVNTKRDPDDDDGDDNEFYGENVGRQNVSKGNENCAGRS